MKNKVGESDSLITGSLTGFRGEQAYDVIEKEQQKPGRKIKLNVPSGKRDLVGYFLIKVSSEENTDSNSNHDAQSNEFQTSQDKKT